MASVVCPQCAAENPASAEFCKSCLGSLTGPTAAFQRGAASGWDAAAPAAPTSDPPPPAPVLPVVPVAPLVPLAAGEGCPLHPSYPIAGTCSRCGKFVCIQCEPDLAATEKPRCESCRALEGATPEGGIPIGGWLVLPALFLLVSPLRLFNFARLFFPLLKTGAFLRASPGLRVLISAEGLFAIAQLGFSLYIAINFFKHKRRTPTLMIMFYGALAVLVVVDHVFAVELGRKAAEAPMSRYISPLIGALIWIPYFLTSKRVRDTFVVP